MTSKPSNPFFSELGKILNLVRNISTEINAGITIEDRNNGKLFDVMNTRNAAIEKLQGRLQQLETEIEYFFTENGLRKTIENRFNTQDLKSKFSNAFKALSKEYFMLKPSEEKRESEPYAGTEEPTF
jgi:vacuolar-type H+-ATPase subunit I/STV1